MTCRVDTTPLVASRCVVSLYAGHGITGAAMRLATATGDNGPGILYPCWDSGDDAKEFRFLLNTPPSAGTLNLGEPGDFDFTGPDGVYSAAGRLVVDGVDLGAVTATLTEGAGGTLTVTGIGQASTLSFGTAVATFQSLFSVAAVGQASSLVMGQATFTREGDFAVIGLGQSSTLAYGSALFTPEGVFTPAAAHPRRLVVTFDPRLQGTTLPGAGGALLQPYPFSPGSRLDVEVDWRKWLNTGDHIETFSFRWGGDELGTLDSDALGEDVCRTWLTVPDNAEELARSEIVCDITTAGGRDDNRKFELLVKQL